MKPSVVQIDIKIIAMKAHFASSCQRARTAEQPQIARLLLHLLGTLALPATGCFDWQPNAGFMDELPYPNNRSYVDR